MKVKRLVSEVWNAAEIERDTPPLFDDSKKKFLYRLAGGVPDQSQSSDVGVYKVILDADLTGLTLSGNCSVVIDPGYFTYLPTQPQGTADWYMNFADRHLFGFYYGDLFAQDEMQVAEHPVLASIRHQLEKCSVHREQFAPLTRQHDGIPTPFLIAGAERRIAVDTMPNETDRPYGLYGNEFASATEEQIQSATARLNPPTLSYILAMDAPEPGVGVYRQSEISQALTTASTGFSGVKDYVNNMSNDDLAIVHSGNWGCGAFGGNPELMYLVQMVAADLAGIDQLILHAVDKLSFKQALKKYQELSAQQSNFLKIVSDIDQQRYEWGMSNGT